MLSRSLVTQPLFMRRWKRQERKAVLLFEGMPVEDKPKDRKSILRWCLTNCPSVCTFDTQTSNHPDNRAALGKHHTQVSFSLELIRVAYALSHSRFGLGEPTHRRHKQSIRYYRVEFWDCRKTHLRMFNAPEYGRNHRE